MGNINIHDACERGDLGEVERYLEAGGDIEKEDWVSSFPASGLSLLISLSLDILLCQKPVTMARLKWPPCSWRREPLWSLGIM
jgi:hypothetical protein